jgi:hypothetical protein
MLSQSNVKRRQASVQYMSVNHVTYVGANFEYRAAGSGLVAAQILFHISFLVSNPATGMIKSITQGKMILPGGLRLVDRTDGRSQKQILPILRFQGKLEEKGGCSTH